MEKSVAFAKSKETGQKPFAYLETSSIPVRAQVFPPFSHLVSTGVPE